MTSRIASSAATQRAPSARRRACVESTRKREKAWTIRTQELLAARSVATSREAAKRARTATRRKETARGSTAGTLQCRAMADRPTVAVDLRALVPAATGIGVYTRSLLLGLAARGGLRYVGMAHRPPRETAEVGGGGDGRADHD